MKINIYLFALLISYAGLAKSQELYDVAKIPAELLKNSTVVVRNEEQNLVVKSLSSATLSYKTAVTILSKNGDGAARMAEYYDKFSSVYNLKATLYNAQGIKIKSYKSSDFKDESLTDNGTMYDDDRIKKLEFLSAAYPYTIEYSYEKDYNGYIFFPTWNPLDEFACSVEKSSYTLQSPQDIKFNFLKSAGIKTDSTIVNNKVTYKWSCQNLAPIEYEPMATGLAEVTPWVKTSPSQFEYDNSKGKVDNWKDLGSWMYELSSQVQTLPKVPKKR